MSVSGQRGEISLPRARKTTVRKIKKSRIDLPVDEVTVPVDEGTDKSVFIGRDNEECRYRDF